ncbi:MAG TPA: DUF3307 domain-containing protein [Rhizobiaceae bacterium]|nr:DUF3307 domain-containing protein [Rhizobiaceae bacterium]
MTNSTALLLILLQVKHFIFDFVFQTPYQLKNKGIYGHPGGILHSGLHVAGTGVILVALGVTPTLIAAILVGEFLVHYHIDWGKEQITRRTGVTRGAAFWRMIGLDQLLHQFTYIAIAFALSA